MKYKTNQPLQYAYLREVMMNLRACNRALNALRRQFEINNNLLEVRDRTRRISDLAMIHGFEGVEIIADKLSATINKHLPSGENDPVLIFKIESSLKAIQTVLKIEEVIERGMTVERINRSAEVNQQKVELCTRQVIHGLKRETGQDDEMKIDVQDEQQISELFDIREVDSVITLFEEDEVKNGSTS